MTTYADDFALDPPAVPIVSPCCGQRRAADMLVQTPALPAAAAERLTARFGWRTMPAYLCDGCRATMHRERLVTGLGIRGTR